MSNNEAFIAQLISLIRCYAKHPSSCPKGVGIGLYRPPADAVCDCGIDAALKTAERRRASQ